MRKGAETLQKADQLELVLDKGGFPLIEITFSWKDPLSILPAEDKVSSFARK